ncbi:MAG: type II CAAX endopeptidase family protein [Clostridia bacterium]
MENKKQQLNNNEQPIKVEYTRYDAGTFSLLATVAPLVMQAIFVAIVVYRFGINYTTSQDPLIIAIGLLVPQLSYLAAWMLFNVFNPIKICSANKLSSKIAYKNILPLVAIALICVLGINGLMEVLFQLINGWGYGKAGSLSLVMNSFPTYLLGLFVMAVVPAIVEELFFRGVIVNGLKEQGIKWQIFGSAIIFMLAHGNLLQMVYPFVLGILLALILLKTKNLLACMLVHFVNNFVVVTATYITTITKSTFVPALSPLFIIVSIVFAVASMLASLMLIKKLKTKNNVVSTKTIDQIPDKQTNAEISKNGANTLLYLGIAVLVIVWVFNVILQFKGV